MTRVTRVKPGLLPIWNAVKRMYVSLTLIAVLSTLIAVLSIIDHACMAVVVTP